MKMKKLLSIILCLVMLISCLAACSSGEKTPDAPAGNAPADAPAANGAEPVTIQVFSNLTDRTTGQGLIEQMLFDQYVAENPHVTIKVESLDDESYKTKFKAYASGSSMPDLVNIWCFPSFLDEVVAADLLAPLNAEDYADYGFADGSTAGVTYDGVMYGLPRNTDVVGFYYNKDMFAQYNLEIPTTWDELLTVCQTLKDNGVSAISMDGMEGWPLNQFIHFAAGTVLGADTYDVALSAVQNQDYSNPVWTDVISAVAENADVLFQPGFETTDYGTSMNLFLNGQAGMFYMGSWEMSMTPDFNVGYFEMPDFDGDGEVAFAAYNGGGYAVTNNSPVKEEALKLLNYMFLPENWSKLCWENGVCMSAQDFAQYLTGTETSLQMDIINLLNGASCITGTPYNDLGSSAYKAISETGATEVIAGMVSVEDHLAALASTK